MYMYLEEPMYLKVSKKSLSLEKVLNWKRFLRLSE